MSLISDHRGFSLNALTSRDHERLADGRTCSTDIRWFRHGATASLGFRDRVENG